VRNVLICELFQSGSFARVVEAENQNSRLKGYT
jgi:hypothetical protein